MIRLLIGAALLGALLAPLPSMSEETGVYMIAKSEPEQPVKAEPPANKPAAANNAAKGLTLDEVLRNYYRAIGGLGSWQSVNTLVIEGKILSQKREFTTTAEYMRPDKCRVEYSIGGKLVIQAYNGETAWQQNPISDKPSPEPLDRARTNYLSDRCGIESPLINYAKKKHKVSLEGMESVDGKETYKIKVTYPTGNFQFYFLDAATFLPLKTIGFYTVEGSEIVMMTKFEDYRKTGNVVVPFRLAIDKKGGGPHEDYVVESVILNSPLDPGIFNMP